MSQHNRLGSLSASTLIGDKVKNSEDEDLGKIEDLMIDLDSGRITYALLSFGGFLGMGDKFFAVPWMSLEIDLEEKCVRFDMDPERLEKAPGFDKDNWPKSTDFRVETSVYEFYGVDNPFISRD
jgi:sporulation protein YlmC with PRC-barrel domain